MKSLLCCALERVALLLFDVSLVCGLGGLWLRKVTGFFTTICTGATSSTKELIEYRYVCHATKLNTQTAPDLVLLCCRNKSTTMTLHAGRVSTKWTQEQVRHRFAFDLLALVENNLLEGWV